MGGVQEKELGKNYNRAAWFYETAAAIFSAGAIYGSKKHLVRQMHAGDKVLFLGVGSGEDALLAAKKGVHVTCIDLSRKMLCRLENKLRQKNLSAELILGNAFDHQRLATYDSVAANYFLNIFFKKEMESMVRHASALLKPNGKLLIADVARAQGNVFARCFNIVYLKLGMVSFWFLGLVPLHRNYDFRQALIDADFKIQDGRLFRFLKFGPVLFQSIVAVKK